MYFIGLDLAFSQKNNTGIAVLQGSSSDDESLIYVTSGLAKSDEAILDVILPYLVPGETVVAVGQRGESR